MNLTQQTSQKIRESIENGAFLPGDKLPSENMLGKQYGVSRSTIRGALSHLQALGIIEQRQGSGTYVCFKEDVRAGLQELDSITDSIRQSGKEPSVEVSSVQRRHLSPEEASFVGSSTSALAVEVRRIISANGIPIAYSIDLLPEEVLPSDFELTEIDGPLFRLCKSRLDIFPHHSTADIHAVHSKHIAWGKEAKAHDLFVLLKQLHFDSQNVLFLYSQTFFIEGRYTFSISRSISEIS
ncbi:GntR family transcriptional regulator [uncultured Corynebacterium sp.]|uniref:GntR family transcriptional regulator n=1 Tax=uncultured Corynebacterium sp. TaxID=159447 RepID=UPI0025FED275|nr:GntR family transcriptional regulator [uncultured Corynebacterium sp.]